AIFASSALLLVAALLNYIFPDATKVFTYVTTISTVLFLVVWGLIIIAYINYSRKNPDLHKNATYKLLGGKYMGYLIFVFFIFVFGLLFINVDTRRAIYFIPIWFILLAFMYLRYKRIAAKSNK
ncbi:TPA: gamma-aminobutyrate permease, partial [Staphylococcus aureus]|nr:gamma-aminobutyrate permease [Staphylococcus aureus]